MQLTFRADRRPALRALVLVLGIAIASTAAATSTKESVSQSSCLLQRALRFNSDARPPLAEADPGTALKQEKGGSEALPLGAQRTRLWSDSEALKNYHCSGNLELPGNELGGLVVVVAGHPDCDVSFLWDQPHRALVVSDIDGDGRRKYYGYEAGAYLRFILDNYDSLPQKMALIHGHRQAWEVNDEAVMLKHLNPNSYDFAPLTRAWALDFPAESLALHRTHLEAMLGAGDPLVQNLPDEPCKFSFAAGAAFLVDRTRVLLHPKTFWQRIYDWLQEETDAVKSKRRAMSLEFAWHMLLGEKPEMLPPTPARLCPGEPSACAHGPFAGGQVNLSDWRLDWYRRSDNDGDGRNPVP